MSFFSQLIELFETLFYGSNPEVRQKQDLRKIDTELRNFQPAIYKSRQVLPNFAEVFRILHVHSIPLSELFSETIANPDVKFREHYRDILIQTGFSDKSKEILEKMKYENRKKEFLQDLSKQASRMERQAETAEYGGNRVAIIKIMQPQLLVQNMMLLY